MGKNNTTITKNCFLFCFASNFCLLFLFYIIINMPDHLGEDRRKVKDDDAEEIPIKVLDEEDIALLKTYGAGMYSAQIKKTEDDTEATLKRVNELTGIKESDTG